MPSKLFLGNAASKSTVWAFAPDINAKQNTWTLTLNGKTLTYVSQAGTAADAVAGMLNLWNASSEPEFQEIAASVPSTTPPADNPQGPGTNEIQALYITGAPTGGSFQLSWAGTLTPFVNDPVGGPAVADSGSSGNLSGKYLYTVTFLNVNPLGQIGETKPSPELPVSVAAHSVNVTLPTSDDVNCIGRRIYRTVAGGASGSERLVDTIWDNTSTAYLDNIADANLGANQPTSNSTGIPYNATASQLQAVLQSLQPIGPGNVVVTGNGTPASPWLIQFTNTLGALVQPGFSPAFQSFTYAITVPAGTIPKVQGVEIQQGIAPNASIATSGEVLLLVGTTGVPFYVTSELSGEVLPTLLVGDASPPVPVNPSLSITAIAPTLSVARVTAGQTPRNELQLLSINPNGKSGSTFSLSWNGHATNSIPLPPSAPTVALGSAGNPNGAYYYLTTFLTATGETEPSAPSAQISAALQEVTVTIPTGASVVTARRIYRTIAGGAITGPYYLVGTVNDNSTTTFTDNSSDATILANPGPPTTNGVLQGELEALSGVGVGNVQVSGANFTAFSGMTFQEGFASYPPAVSSAALNVNGPSISAITASLSGGALTAGTYYYTVTTVDSQGESTGRTELSVEVSSSTGRVVLTWGTVTTAVAYRVYRGTAPAQESTLVGMVSGTTSSFIDYGTFPAPINYEVEFIGSLGNAPQALMTGNSSGVSILPVVSVSETQAGFPIQNEVQVVGWTQKYGNVAATGQMAIQFPSLGFTSSLFNANSQADQVLAAIQAQAPAANFNDFAVTVLESTPGAQLYAIAYQGTLSKREIPLATVQSALVAASGDTVTPYSRRAALGSSVGRNEIITVTIEDSPSGGTFGLTGTLSNGNTISATGVAYNASAATLQAAFPAATVNVSGNAGGPYTMEAVGQAGSQKVVWTASSSLLSPAPPSGNPPASNTAAIPNPVVTLTRGTSNGALATATYYYKVTAVNGQGETNGAEVSASVTGPTGNVVLSWAAIPTATSYNIYRGTSAGGENVKIANTTALTYTDYGGTNTTATLPVSNTATLPAPTGLSTSVVPLSGAMSAGTYYYKITATDTAGETTASSEVNAVVASNGAVLLSWTAVSGATGYKLYRGTASGSENALVATIASGTQASFYDTGVSTASSTSPPGSYTAPLAAPTLTSATPSVSGVLTAGTYFFEVTATNGSGETTASNELSATVSAGGSVALAWNAVSGATGYKVYRGTSSGGESKLVATLGTQTSFIDSGASTATSATPPASNTTGLVAPTFQAIYDNGQSNSSFAVGTYYYVITAVNSSGETNPSAEVSVSVSHANDGIFVEWQMVTGAEYYNIYRGTTAGGENVRYSISNGTINGNYMSYVDNGFGGTGYPPSSNTTSISAPTQLAPTNGSSGQLSAATYYYTITATNSSGETTASNEQSVAVSANGDVLVSWGQVTGATGYKVYRGTSSGGENLLVATITSGSQTSYYDSGESTATNASPPTTNSSGVPIPTQNQPQVGSAGILAAGTYYYEVTAYNGSEETTVSNEQVAVVTNASGDVVISWTEPTGYNVTGFKVYRGTSSSGENKLLATLASSSQTTFYDNGASTPTSVSPPVSNTSTITVPVQTAPSAGTTGGILATNTYYYVLTAITANGETTVSNEESIAVTGPTAVVTLNWTADSGASGYKIYRGTSAAGENKLIATVNSGAAVSFVDDGTTTVSASPPGTNTAVIVAPTQTAPSASSTGGALASATYYYVVTALTALGETTKSNEENIAVTGPNGEATINWTVDTGATGYKIYRGTVGSGENLLVGTITNSSATSFTDAGNYTGALAVTEVFQGQQPINEVQSITITNAGAGFFSVQFENNSTGLVPWNVSASSLQASLTAMPLVGAGNATVSASVANGQTVYTITYVGAMAAQGQPLLAALGTTNQSSPPTVNLTGESPPLNAVLSLAQVPGSVTQPRTYVVTAMFASGETAASNGVAGGGNPNFGVQFFWTAVAGADSYNIYYSVVGGDGTQYLIGNVVSSDAEPSFIDNGLESYIPLKGGAVYQVVLANGETNQFNLSFAGATTGNIQATASDSTVQSDLQLLGSIGTGNATVTGVPGNWLISLAPSIVGTGTLTGTIVTQTTSPVPKQMFVVTINDASGGTFTLSYAGRSAVFVYNVTTADMQTALQAIVFNGTVSVAGAAGAYYFITITPTIGSLTGNTLKGDGSSLTGSFSTLAVYPLVYSLATGPNFYDAPQNWSGGTLPALYLAPPVITAVVPTSTDSTLVPGTHGSLTSKQTYYYKVTALNANGETVGSAEASGTAFAGAKLYFAGTATGNNYSLTYGGQSANDIAYNLPAAGIQNSLQQLSSIGTGNCTVTGTGTTSDPFVFTLSGALAGTAPSALGIANNLVTGATLSVLNSDTRSLAISWSKVDGATSYRVYRGTAAGQENALVATLAGPDTTTFVDDGTYTTTSASPPTDTNSYHTAVGDDVYFNNSSVSCLYGIAASPVNGYSIHGGFNGLNYGQVNSLTIDASYTGFIGPPVVNPAGYAEYRPTLLTIMGPPGGTFVITIGSGSGSGSANIGLDTGTSQIAMSVTTLGTSSGTLPIALAWIGTNGSSEIDLFRGSMGIAPYPGQTAQLGTVRQAYQTNQNTDTTLFIGAGCAPIATFVKSGGTTTMQADAVTLQGKGGTVYQQAGAVTGTLNLVNCTYVSQSTDDMGIVNVSNGGVFDRSQDSRPVKVAEASVYPGAIYDDPHGATYNTVVGTMTVNSPQCGLQPGDSNGAWVDLGRNISVQRTNN